MSDQRITPRTDPEDGSMFCRRCGHYLAKNCDGVFLLAGGIRLFGEVRYSCHNCLKPHRFLERPPNAEPMPEGSVAVLNALALESKFKTEGKEDLD